MLLLITLKMVTFFFFFKHPEMTNAFTGTSPLQANGLGKIFSFLTKCALTSGEVFNKGLLGLTARGELWR